MLLILRISFIVVLFVFCLTLLWCLKKIKTTIEHEKYLLEIKREKTLEKWCKLSYEDLKLLCNCNYVPLKKDEYEHSLNIIKWKLGEYASNICFTAEEWRKVIMNKEIGYAKTFFWARNIYNELNGKTSSDTE